MRVLIVGAVACAFVGIAAFASCSDDPVLGVEDASLAESSSPHDESGLRATDASLAADVGADVAVPLVDTCVADAGPFPNTWVADHLCLTVYGEGGGVTREMAFAPNGDLFVSVSGTIQVMVDINGDHAIAAAELFPFQVNSLGLSGGLAIDPSAAHIYASSPTEIYRWAYAKGDRVASAPPELVVYGMPSDGHFSRSLVFDPEGRLYVNVGSYGDVDIDPALNATRDQVRRFEIPSALPMGGIAYASGEPFALGLRNEVGLAFDSKGRMWGVENGSDGLYLPVETLDNPAEEINWLNAPGPRYYGYPDCWTEYGFDGGLGNGTQWAYARPDPKTDSYCRDPELVQPPAGAMHGHWASLGVTEVTGGSLPWQGDLLVTSHGSSYRMPPIGRLVAHARLVGNKVASIEPILGGLGSDGGLAEGTWIPRPVDVRMGPDGAAYFSDDYTGRVFRLGYRP